MSFLAVKGLNIQILPPVIGNMESNISIITQPSENIKIEGNGVYSGPMTISVSGTSYSGLSQVSPVSITINPETIKNIGVDGKISLAAGDKGKTLVPATFKTGDATESSYIEVMIADAGQNKVEGK